MVSNTVLPKISRGIAFLANLESGFVHAMTTLRSYWSHRSAMNNRTLVHLQLVLLIDMFGFNSHSFPRLPGEKIPLKWRQLEIKQIDCERRRTSSRMTCIKKLNWLCCSCMSARGSPRVFVISFTMNISKRLGACWAPKTIFGKPVLWNISVVTWQVRKIDWEICENFN